MKNAVVNITFGDKHFGYDNSTRNPHSKVIKLMWPIVLNEAVADMMLEERSKRRTRTPSHRKSVELSSDPLHKWVWL